MGIFSQDITPSKEIGSLSNERRQLITGFINFLRRTPLDTAFGPELYKIAVILTTKISDCHSPQKSEPSIVNSGFCFDLMRDPSRALESFWMALQSFKFKLSLEHQTRSVELVVNFNISESERDQILGCLVNACLSIFRGVEIVHRLYEAENRNCSLDHLNPTQYDPFNIEYFSQIWGKRGLNPSFLIYFNSRCALEVSLYRGIQQLLNDSYTLDSKAIERLFRWEAVFSLYNPNNPQTSDFCYDVAEILLGLKPTYHPQVSIVHHQDLHFLSLLTELAIDQQ